MNSWNNIPTEVLQDVLKLLNRDTDRKAICNCALVCKNWTHPMQHFIYTHVEIETESKFNKFLNTLENNPQLGKVVKRLKFGLFYSQQKLSQARNKLDFILLRRSCLIICLVLKNLTVLTTVAIFRLY